MMVEPVTVLVALHARKSHSSIQRFRETASSCSRLVVALTGTDLYRDFHTSAEVEQSLQLATRLVVLQRQALAELPRQLQRKTHVIYQSAQSMGRRLSPPPSHFQVCIIGHLRREKDPFRIALAARQLSESSQVKVFHAGCALSPDMGKKSQRGKQAKSCVTSGWVSSPTERRAGCSPAAISSC